MSERKNEKKQKTSWLREKKEWEERDVGERKKEKMAPFNLPTA